ncbi:MAG TPA: cyclic nucleotide-binding domain-containing protein [Bryobacteraceae bacterium]|nr:cyclic nucleotide-binding domain-containing protein [Bryobacteraceae bacterium]
MTEQEVTSEILGVLRSMDLFKGKDPDELTEWLGKAPFEGGAECALRQFATGERITTEGNFGNTFFILIRGTVRVTLGSEAQPLATLGQGSFFGEMTLISGLPRNASVTALEPCEAIEVPRRAFEYLMKKPGPFRTLMDQTYIERGLANHLRTIPEFAGIDTKVLQELVKKVRLRIFSKDEVVVEEGEAADSFYLIREGFVRVVKKMAGGEQRTVAYLKDGAYFGETALLSDQHRNASIVAMGKVEVIQVMKEDFFALVNRDEKFADSLEEEERRRKVEKPSPAASPLGFVGEVVERGLIKATSALVIHLNVCTRCGNCVKACAELHDGISRLTRHGMLFEAPQRQAVNLLEPLLVTTSCMHCLDPECMIGCPTGAITRDVNGEVIVQDSCIGCGNCARRCPYGNISMADARSREELAKQRTGAPIIGGYLKLWKTPENEPMMNEIETNNQKAVVRRIAVKCDLCQDYHYNHGCVHNCPYGAIERMDASAYLYEVRGAE